jgi:hypothetical protein
LRLQRKLFSRSAVVEKHPNRIEMVRNYLPELMKWRCAHIVQCISKKIYRLKEDQAFSLSLELGQREKVAGHPSAEFLLHSVGGGGDFVDTVIVVKVV